MMMIKNKPVLQHVIERVQQSNVNKVMVATSIDERNKPIVELCKKLDVKCYQGSENDVLDRFYMCCLIENADHIVRICADGCCFDYKIINKLIEKHLNEENELTTTSFLNKLTMPDGTDIEIIERTSLYRCWLESRLYSDRLNVTTYIKNNKKRFQIRDMPLEKDYNYIRLSIDYQDDYELVKKVYDELYDKNNYFGLEEIIELFERKPELLEINKHIKNNEGYKLDKLKD
jgi:spore coat polysaccharide biosynthesis protein SpsF